MRFYKNESPRLKNWDYGSDSYYFITICVRNNENLLGEFRFVGTDHDPTINKNPQLPIWKDRDPFLHLSSIGEIAQKYWEEIPQHFAFVQLNSFIIMPNHIHGIIQIRKNEKTSWTPNKYSSPKENLGSIIRQYKGSVKRYANKNNIPFQWQNGYHDRIIHNSIDLTNIQTYIQNNPKKWIERYKLSLNV